MRDIKYLVVHCTATPQTATVQSIKSYWKNTLGWKQPGYHYLVEANGTHHQLLPIDQVSNGVKGYNSVSIHVSYIGGIDAKGNPTDNRTPEQKNKMSAILRMLKKQFPEAIIQGHRDFPGVNKACPSFEAKSYYKNLV